LKHYATFCVKKNFFLTKNKKNFYKIIFWIKEAKNPFFPDFIGFFWGPQKRPKKGLKTAILLPVSCEAKTGFLPFF